MIEPDAKTPLKLEVKNFGPIIDAKLELRPMTVFVGPSNTGKSYLSMLIYALHKFFKIHQRFNEWYFFEDYLLGSTGTFIHSFSNRDVEDILNLAESLLNHYDSLNRTSIVLPLSTADLLRSSINNSANSVFSEIVRCFGVGGISELIRKGQKESNLLMRQKLSRQTDFAEFRVKLAKSLEFDVTIPAEVPIPINQETNDRIHQMVPESRIKSLLNQKKKDKSDVRLRYKAAEMLSSVFKAILPSLIGPMHSSAYYLPADRTGIMHAHHVVVSALIANAPTAGLRPPIQTPTLSGVLADFLEQLINIDLDRTNFRNHELTVGQDISKDLEQSILGGSIGVDRLRYNSYPKFGYRPKGWNREISLGHASSMVSELAPVVLYLRYKVKPDNVLIVEEPESHLHPAMQVLLIRQLASLVKAGIRVIVTTHSEWILQELANILQRSGLPDSAQNNKISLLPNEVGTWLFKPKKRPKGAVVKKIDLEETGLYPSGFDEVSSELHNEWCNIFSHLEGNS